MIAWHLPLNLNFFYTKGELRHLFLSGVARRVAVTLLALFSPVYIFQVAKGLGLENERAIIWVLSYFLFICLVKLVSLSISEDLSRKIGFKGTIWASSFPFFSFRSQHCFCFLLSSFVFGSGRFVGNTRRVILVGLSRLFC